MACCTPRVHLSRIVPSDDGGPWMGEYDCTENDQDESSREFVVGKTHVVLLYSGDFKSTNLVFCMRTLESSMKFVHASTLARLAVVIVLGAGLEKVLALGLQDTSSVRFLNIFPCFLLYYYAQSNR